MFPFPKRTHRTEEKTSLCCTVEESTHGVHPLCMSFETLPAFRTSQSLETLEMRHDMDVDKMSKLKVKLDIGEVLKRGCRNHAGRLNIRKSFVKIISQRSLIGI